MKILITTDWYAPTVNGVVTSVINLKEGLEKLGHEVRILTLAQNGGGKGWFLHGGQQENVWYLPSAGAGKIYPGARIVLGPGREFLEEMIRWKPDVVHSQCEFTTFWFARRIVKATGAKFLHTYHTVYEDYTHYFSPNRKVGKKAASAFSRHILKQVDAVVAPSEKVRHLLEAYGVAQPIHTVPTGIDCGKFARARERDRGNVEDTEAGSVQRRNLVRDSVCRGKDKSSVSLSDKQGANTAEMTSCPWIEDGVLATADAEKKKTAKTGMLSGKTVSARQKRLITVGRLAREKNTEEILRWLAGKRGETYRLLIVGDGPYREDLEFLATELGIRDRVEFAGMAAPSEVADWYQQGGIFVSASASETQGLTYLEALASGLPAVCRKDACLEGVIENGRNGWQYEDRNGFFEALERLADPRLYETVAAEAAASAEKFDRKQFAGRICRIYERLLEEETSWTLHQNREPHFG